MSLKKFQPALSDCQQTLFILGSSSTSPLASKTLLRMARCQYAVGSTSAAQSAALATLSRLLCLEVTSHSTSPSSCTQAVQLKQKILAKRQPRQEYRERLQETLRGDPIEMYLLIMSRQGSLTLPRHSDRLQYCYSAQVAQARGLSDGKSCIPFESSQNTVLIDDL